MATGFRVAGTRPCPAPPQPKRLEDTTLATRPDARGNVGRSSRAPIPARSLFARGQFSLGLPCREASRTWATAVDAPPAPRSSPGAEGVREADVIVIGSGIGGLCCAALLARYGVNVGAPRARAPCL